MQAEHDETRPYSAVQPPMADGGAAELENLRPDSSDSRPSSIVYIKDLEGICSGSMDFGMNASESPISLRDRSDATLHGRNSAELPIYDTPESNITAPQSAVEVQDPQPTMFLSNATGKEIYARDPAGTGLWVLRSHFERERSMEADPDLTRSPGTQIMNRGKARAVENADYDHSSARSLPTTIASDDIGESSPIYTTLNDNTKGIRLLSFHASHGLVSGKLEQFDDVNDCPPFIALSYTWGDEASKRDIKLNGSRFSVRKNLHDFMHHLSMAKHIWGEKVYGDDAASAVAQNAFLENPILWDYWWIDAICIDQESIKEKNHQVHIMSDIYSQAAFVFIWLGVDLENLVENERDGHARGWMPSSKVKPFYMSEAFSSSEIVCTSEITRILLKNIYWTRLWIVQEFVLAKELLLCAGGLVVKWKEFRDKALDLEKELQIRNGFLNSLMEQRYHRESGELRERMSSLVEKFCMTSCTDPRDRVFGLLGISNTSFDADYSLTVREVFVGVLKAELEIIVWEEDFETLRSLSAALRRALRIDIDLADELWSTHVCVDIDKWKDVPRRSFHLTIPGTWTGL